MWERVKMIFKISIRKAKKYYYLSSTDQTKLQLYQLLQINFNELSPMESSK